MRSFLCCCKFRRYSSKSSNIANPQRSRTVYLGHLPDKFSLDDIFSSHLHNGESFGALGRIHVLPERHCAFIDFLRLENATRFLKSAARNSLSIDGKILDVGPASTITTPANLICAIGLRNATRTLKFSSLDSSWTADGIRTKLQPYGFVEHIHINQEGAYALVSFMDIMTASKVMDAIRTTEAGPWTNIEVKMTTDRFDTVPYSNLSYAAKKQHGFSAYKPRGNRGPLQERAVAFDSLPVGMLLGHFLSVVSTGLIQRVDYYKMRGLAFVHYASPDDAAKVMQKTLPAEWRRVRRRPIMLPAVYSHLATAIEMGLTRTIFIGNIPDNELHNNVWCRDPREDLDEKVAESIYFIKLWMEQRHGVPNCCFINFTNMKHSLQAMESLCNNPEYNKYTLAFGRDRFVPKPHNSEFAMTSLQS